MVRGCPHGVTEFAFGVVDDAPRKPGFDDHHLTMHFLAVCSEHPLGDVADEDIYPADLRFWLERRGASLYPRPVTSEGRALAELMPGIGGSEGGKVQGGEHGRAGRSTPPAAEVKGQDE